MNTSILETWFSYRYVMCSSTSIPSASHLHVRTENSPALQASARSFLPSNRVHMTPNLSYDSIAHSSPVGAGPPRPSKKRNVEVACGTNASAPQDENKALETVLRLYEAIRNRNHCELSDIIAEECLCVSNFVSAFRPFLGKQQVLAFFSSLMKSLGKNLELVVQQTLEDGMVVTVSWKLEWNKVPLPLGRGFSLHMCHTYRGKVMIRNVEIFLEPILHKVPLRLKLISLVMTGLEKINPKDLFASKTRRRRAIVVLFIVLLVAVIVFLLKT